MMKAIKVLGVAHPELDSICVGVEMPLIGKDDETEEVTFCVSFNRSGSPVIHSAATKTSLHVGSGFFSERWKAYAIRRALSKCRVAGRKAKRQVESLTFSA